MTEAEWLAGTNPQRMLIDLSDIATLNDRKLRLFAVACCRRVWFWLEEKENAKALEAHERVADDLPVEIRGVYGKPPVWAVGEEFRVTLDWTGWSFATTAAYQSVKEVGELKGTTDCELIRDIIGNPFRPVPNVDPTWLLWNERTVVRIAQAIYDERAFDRMPILADALEDAGCNDADILRHCREPGEHVRGCWVIDLLLGKE